jgi:hypothetical protein
MLKEEERHRPTPLASFLNATECFTYLGNRIVPEIDHIVSNNYDPVVDSITQSISRWSSLPVSFVGRINILKN